MDNKPKSKFYRFIDENVKKKVFLVNEKKYVFRNFNDYYTWKINMQPRFSEESAYMWSFNNPSINTVFSNL